MEEIKKQLEQWKTDREVDEHNESHEFRLGYVKAMNNAMTLINNHGDIGNVSNRFTEDDMLKEYARGFNHGVGSNRIL